MAKERKNKIQWIYFVAKRFSLVDLKGAAAFSSRLSTLGICFGVMTLIIVMSVMNGFQREFIDAIMEVSSYHVRAKNYEENEGDFFSYLEENKNVLCYTDFIESEGLAVSASGMQGAVLARGVDKDILKKDSGFKGQLKIIRGKFDLKNKILGESGFMLEPVVVGSSLSRSLGLRVGDEVKLYSINSEKPLSQAFSEPKTFCVSGIFFTGYDDINSTYLFMEKDVAREFFPSSSPVVGIKITGAAHDGFLKKDIQKKFPKIRAESWREYNRSFFSVLRVEKNMLLFFVVLIFVVVAINIFNSMRRIVFERRFEISALSALGGDVSSIKNIFIMRGLLTGVRGAVPGLVLGMFVCINIKFVFKFLSLLIFYAQYYFLRIVNPMAAFSLTENPMFEVYAKIPAKMYFGEVAFITLFGIFSALISSWLASRQVLKTSISEVLHDE